MLLKLISTNLNKDGTLSRRENVQIVDVKTGERLEMVQSVKFEADCVNLPKMTLVILCPEVEVECDNIEIEQKFK